MALEKHLQQDRTSQWQQHPPAWLGSGSCGPGETPTTGQNISMATTSSCMAQFRFLWPWRNTYNRTEHLNGNNILLHGSVQVLVALEKHLQQDRTSQRQQHPPAWLGSGSCGPGETSTTGQNISMATTSSCMARFRFLWPWRNTYNRTEHLNGNNILLHGSVQVLVALEKHLQQDRTLQWQQSPPAWLGSGSCGPGETPTTGQNITMATKSSCMARFRFLCFHYD